jgi:hypothetical protein
MYTDGHALNYRILCQTCIEDIRNKYYYKHYKFTQPELSEADVVKTLILFDNYTTLFLKKYVRANVVNETSLDIKNFNTKGLIKFDFVFGIHVNNIKNCKTLRLYHRSNDKEPLFEKVCNHDTTEVYVPLSTEEEPTGMFVTSTSLMSVIPRYALQDLRIVLDAADTADTADTADAESPATADVLLSIGYFNMSTVVQDYTFEHINETMRTFMALRDSTYYVNGKKVTSYVEKTQGKKTSKKTFCEWVFGK